MSWSFDASLSETRDQVRELVGDTLSADQLASNESIELQLDLAGDGLFTAAAAVCRSIAGRFAREVNAGLAGLNESASDRFRHFRELAEEYRREAQRRGEAPSATGAAGSAGPVLTGVSIGEIRSVERDVDRPRSAFRSSGRRGRRHVRDGYEEAHDLDGFRESGIGW